MQITVVILEPPPPKKRAHSNDKLRAYRLAEGLLVMR